MLDPNKKLFRYGPISACPLFMYFTIEKSFAPMHQYFGTGWPESVIIFSNNKVNWLQDLKDFQSNSQKFVQININNHNKRKQYFNEWHSRTKQLISHLKSLNIVKLNNLSDQDILDHYNLFKKVYFHWWAFTMSLEQVTVTIEPLLGRRLRPYYKDERDYNRDFSTLTSPLKLTFYRRELRDMLRIINKKHKDPSTELEKHRNQYCWIYNSYLEGKILSQEYFETEYNQLLTENWQRTLKEVENYSNDIKQQKKRIIDSIKPSKEVKDLIHLVETFAYLQDERKENNFRAEHYLELFAKRFAQRNDIDVIDVKYLLPDEISQAKLSTYKSAISKRRESFVIIADKNDMEFLSGDNAKAIADKYAKTPKITGTMLHGQLASSGSTPYFRGIAKIVLTIDKIDKIESGDILITTMTSPDFVIGMKKAGAIITDVGGMLCHAAVVSRELNIPCIVNTEVATKVIQDGDIVELHCGRGTVKIIKKN